MSQQEGEPRSSSDSFGRADESKSDLLQGVQEEIERQRARAQEEGRNFTAPSEEELKRKLFGGRTPQIVFQSWTSTVAPGGTVNYSVGINNPDAFLQIWMFVHLFVGPANFVPDVGDAVSAVDTRFPRLTEPPFDGLSLDPGATASLDFVIPVPASVEPSNYLGNSFLFQSTWHDPGIYFDRSLFVFQVA